MRPVPDADDPGDREDHQGWVRRLDAGHPGHVAAVAELHAVLLRGARSECRRRSGTHGLSGTEMDDVANQAADDAVMSVLRRVGDFRGESRFTTWAYAFVVREVATKVGRHVWRRDGVAADEASWERLPERWCEGPEACAQTADLVATLREGVETRLTPHQRDVFLALVVHGTPLDVLTAELGCQRNAVYKTMYDARRKLRAHLVERGVLGPDD